VCAIAILSAACSYRSLSFFFDGVPPPRATTAGPAVPSGLRKSASPAVLKGSEHGPYAAKQCDGCHVAGRGNALLVPAEQLCARCHVLALDKKFVHGPLTSGGCLLCHDPHSSQHAFLLVGESGTFCIRCHDPRALRAVEGHGNAGGACTACHEAHMSDRQFLLR
jgi:predicted CXXCH cytochrome family protein